ncbi:MAG: hypothetical protein K2N10_05380, partial [Muribaculaceae bacterium]|nr:hypothetical protein [Muribaculaceae bacterium]
MKNILLFALTLCMSLSAAAQVVTETRTPKKNENTNLYEKVPEEGKYVGYAGIEIASPGAFGDGGANFGFTTTHGLMGNESIFVGGGLGYIADFYNKQGLFPLFADGRYFFRSQFQRRIYPHIAARRGALIPTQGNVGVMGQLAIGLRVPFSESFAMNIEVGPQYGT